jgi:hypothetical protein
MSRFLPPSKVVDAEVRGGTMRREGGVAGARETASQIIDAASTQAAHQPSGP